MGRGLLLFLVEFGLACSRLCRASEDGCQLQRVGSDVAVGGLLRARGRGFDPAKRLTLTILKVPTTRDKPPQPSKTSPGKHLANALREAKMGTNPLLPQHPETAVSTSAQTGLLSACKVLNILFHIVQTGPPLTFPSGFEHLEFPKTQCWWGSKCRFFFFFLRVLEFWRPCASFLCRVLDGFCLCQGPALAPAPQVAARGPPPLFVTLRRHSRVFLRACGWTSAFTCSPCQVWIVCASKRCLLVCLKLCLKLCYSKSLSE